MFGERTQGPAQISGVTASDPLHDAIVEAAENSFELLVERYKNPPE